MLTNDKTQNWHFFIYIKWKSFLISRDVHSTIFPSSFIYVYMQQWINSSRAITLNSDFSFSNASLFVLTCLFYLSLSLSPFSIKIPSRFFIVFYFLLFILNFSLFYVQKGSIFGFFLVCKKSCDCVCIYVIWIAFFGYSSSFLCKFLIILG